MIIKISILLILIFSYIEDDSMCLKFFVSLNIFALF